jgi:NADH-quinone oxidoreductase subunit A
VNVLEFGVDVRPILLAAPVNLVNIMATFVLLDGDTTLPLFVSLVAALAIAGLILALSFVLAVQSPDPEKTSAYECGFEPFEDARNRFDVRFYIVAILFLLFDIEVAFLFPWAATLGMTGGTSFAIVALFLLLLTAGFLYEVVKGALNPHLSSCPHVASWFSKLLK